MTESPLLLSIQVGLPKERGTEGAAEKMDRPWKSAIFKEPVDGPLWLGRTNLAGDRQANLQVHGGPDKAVLAYSADHYPGWRIELERPDLAHGSFGENFTIAGLTEATVCIGDTYRIGEALVQVTQPRQPCWKLERRLKRDDMITRVEATDRSGWYFRVLAEANVEAGLPVALVERPYPQWPIARAASVMRGRKDDPATAAQLAACPALATSWQERLAAVAAR
jgi:MOSC domain-containing protein YiiM